MRETIALDRNGVALLVSNGVVIGVSTLAPPVDSALDDYAVDVADALWPDDNIMEVPDDGAEIGEGQVTLYPTKHLPGGTEIWDSVIMRGLDDAV